MSPRTFIIIMFGIGYSVVDTFVRMVCSFGDHHQINNSVLEGHHVCGGCRTSLIRYSEISEFSK